MLVCSALHEYVSGRLITAQGEGKKGSVDMMRALKIAHAPLKNHQLVANVTPPQYLKLLLFDPFFRNVNKSQ